jgi:hypothetical protein
MNFSIITIVVLERINIKIFEKNIPCARYLEPTMNSYFLKTCLVLDTKINMPKMKAKRFVSINIFLEIG